MKRWMIVLLVIALVGVVVTGCGEETTQTTATTGGPETTAPSATTPGQSTETTTAATQGDKYGGTMIVAVSAGPSSPGGLPWELLAGDSTALQTIFEPLFRADTEGRPTPWLAESYELADDGLSMTIKLKEGIEFTDGSELNAEVVAWNYQMRIDNHKVPNWKSVEVIDPYTIKLSFFNWDNSLYSTLADSADAWIVSKDNYDKNGEQYAREHPVGTGPFMFDSFQADAYYDVVRNPNYWQEGLPYLDKIHHVVMMDENTKKAALQAGEVDAIELEPGKLVADLQKALTDYTWYGSIFSTLNLILDTATPESPCADKRAREALDYAIDREALAEAFGYGLWGPTYQVPAPDNGAIYDPNYVYPRPYDPEKAKQLLAEAGYTGKKRVQVAIYQCPIPIDSGILTAVQGMWAEVGVDCELVFCKVQTDWNSADEAGEPGTILFEPMGPMGNYNGGLAFQFNPDVPIWNLNWLRTPEYKELYRASAGAREYDPALAKACTDYMVEDASVLPIAGSGKGWMVKNTVKDHGFLTRSFCPWWNMETAYLEK